jgi:integrase
MIAMTNERNNALFESERKNNFLNDMISSGAITSETSKSYLRIFNKTSEKEEALKKDLTEFTLEELETILFDFKANNRNTLESYGRIISSYLNWGVQHQFSKNNPLSELKPNDFEKYLTNEEEYFTERELRRIEDRCENFQDAVILRLLFLGAGGKQMSEIRNLKEQDIDRKNKRIRLINTFKSDKNKMPIKFTERWIHIHGDHAEHTFDLIEGAIRVKSYLKRNGEIAEGNNSRSIGRLDLVENDYVIRASMTNTENFDIPVDRFVIYRRIQMISTLFGIPELTAKYIQRSGMIFLGNELVQDEILSLDDMKIVADRFNMKSYHNLKGFLTVDNIRKSYSK